jgi:hypothetical protein
MYKQPLRVVVIVLGTVSIAATCNPGLAAWKCFTIDSTTPPPPHAAANDEFCVSQRGTAWYLVPGLGMENWKAIGGAGTEIPLTVVTDSPAVKIWDFEVEVTDHPGGSDHGPQHVRPNRGYRLQVNIPGGPNPEAVAVIRVAGPPGDPIHGGTAHGVED